MKYIRTKDGVYKLKKYKEKYHYFKVNSSAYKLQKISECKQANTIEELCDEFVYVNKSIDKTKTIHTLIDEKINLGTNELYGAIWTDKGLIYVAKMNDEGELELL